MSLVKWDRMREILQNINDIGYNPYKHLFSVGINGSLRSRWTPTVDTWEEVGDCYCRWALLNNDDQKVMFWKDIYSFFLKTPDWEGSTEDFRNWIISNGERRGENCQRIHKRTTKSTPSF